MATENRGFGSMDPNKQREIASKGGKSQGKENNQSNFANNPERAQDGGHKRGENRDDRNEFDDPEKSEMEDEEE